MSVVVVSSASDLQSRLAKLKAAGKTIGFVPTMGALHEGHASLLGQARKENDVVVLSIFVNPTQFGVNEDLAKYPRTLASDLVTAQVHGVDFVFTPSAEEIYPAGWSSFIEVEALSGILCGKFRPGHFRGVATVVYRLFQIVTPARAYFGRKDLQQVLVLKRMVKDLAVPVKLISCPTLRDPDGLAMSSRNRFLSVEERQTALVIPKTLDRALEDFQIGEVKTQNLLNSARSIFLTEEGFKLQYLEIRTLPNLKEEESFLGPRALFVAGFVGTTRLIDNRILLPAKVGNESEIDSFI